MSLNKLLTTKALDRVRDNREKKNSLYNQHNNGSLRHLSKNRSSMVSTNSAMPRVWVVFFNVMSNLISFFENETYENGK